MAKVNVTPGHTRTSISSSAGMNLSGRAWRDSLKTVLAAPLMFQKDQKKREATERAGEWDVKRRSVFLPVNSCRNFPREERRYLK